MKYYNFDLELTDDRIEGDDECFNVRARCSLVDNTLDAEPARFRTSLRDTVRQLGMGALEADAMIDMGKELGQALFPSRALGLLRDCLKRLDNRDDERLRVRVLAGTYGLASVPWEYLYLADTNIAPAEEGIDNFFVLNPKTCLLRREVIPGMAGGNLDPLGAGQMRMVVATANPRGQTSLDTPGEAKGIREALSGIPAITAEFLENATKRKTQTALLAGAHIFHFAGHGVFAEQPGARWGELEGAGALLFVDDLGNEDRWPAAALRNALSNRGIRLAVLAACEGARRDSANAWSGVVPSMIKAGIPAVVGMQFKIEDANAVAFSAIFYAALAAGQPIEAAVTEARLAMRSMGALLDWGAPVLYSRVEEGTLFPAALGASGRVGVENAGDRATGPHPPESIPRPDPDLRAIRAYLEAHFDFPGLELLLAEATDRMASDPHPIMSASTSSARATMACLWRLSRRCVGLSSAV